MSSSALGGGGPDPLELASSIGTWVAAAVAIIALVGVVGPFFALQASLSDSNRAMNAVQDIPQKYVTSGFPLTKGLRVLRRIRVPDLSPGYIANLPELSPLITARAARGHWVLQPREYLLWNTGWAKMAELITEAYQVRDGTSNEPGVSNIAAKGGTLEVVNSRTALVVNKHWILLLGLLGRYGTRSDKGVLQRRGIRRDLGGERAPISTFVDTHKLMIEAKEHKHDDSFEWVRKKSHRRRREKESSGSSSSDSETSNSDSDDSFGRSRGEEVMALKRSAYGEWTVEPQKHALVHGITGVMRSLGRHKGYWSYLSSISFTPHTSQQIFGPGTLDKREEVSVTTLFWLAHGFIPCGRTIEGTETILSLEDPAAGTSGLGEYLSNYEGTRDWTLFSLEESDDLPLTIAHSMIHLGIAAPSILQFVAIESYGGNKSDEGKAVDTQAKVSCHIWERILQVSRDNHEILTTDGTFTYYAKSRKSRVRIFPRTQFDRALSSIILLEWDTWGFLVWKSSFWRSALKPATTLLEVADPGMIAATLGQRKHIKAFRWGAITAFRINKLEEFLTLDRLISTFLEKSEALPLRLAIGCLYIVDASLSRKIADVCDRLTLLHRSGHKSEAEVQEAILKAEERVSDCEKSYQISGQERVTDKEEALEEMPSDRPLCYTRMDLRHLDIETLDSLAVDYQKVS